MAVSSLTLLLTQIGVIVLVSRLLGWLLRPLGQPLVIAEVLAGIVLGPSLLGWVWPQAMTGLFPAESLPNLKLLSQLGLVLFMFIIGLELDSRMFKDNARSALFISTSSMVVPFALGAMAAGALYDSLAPKGVGLLPFGLFMGVAMCITAFPVLARILAERNLIHSRVGAIAIGTAAMGDVIAWCLLAFVVGVTRAHALEEAGWTTLLTLGYLVLMYFGLRPVLARLARRVGNREGLTPLMEMTVLLMLLASSAITDIIGIHALFGAFLLGAILPKEGRLAQTLSDRLETVAVVLLLPLFFATSGLHTQLGLLVQPQQWLVALLLITLATLGKFGGSFLAARATGLGLREASAIGILMNTRGLMELIVLNIGLELGVISPTLFTMLVLMALVTTFVTSPVLRWIYPDADMVKHQVAATLPGKPLATNGFNLMMCLSDRTSGPAMTVLAATFAGTQKNAAHLVAVHLHPPSDRPSVERDHLVQEAPTSALGELLRQSQALSLSMQPVSFASNDPAQDICRLAQAHEASLVLLGWHKPLLMEGRLGGLVGRVVARAQNPVGVFVNRGLQQVRRVLVAFAGGPEDLAALKVARHMGQHGPVELTLLHVVPPGELNRPGKGRGQIDQVFADPTLAENFTLRVVEHALPSEAVVEEASRGYDLVIVGMDARWGLETGKISLRRQTVLSDTPVSVLAVHSPSITPGSRS